MQGDIYAHGYKLNGLKVAGAYYGEQYQGIVRTAEPSWTDGIKNGIHMYVDLTKPLKDGRTTIALLDMTWAPKAHGVWSGPRNHTTAIVDF